MACHSQQLRVATINLRQHTLFDYHEDATRQLYYGRRKMSYRSFTRAWNSKCANIVIMKLREDVYANSRICSQKFHGVLLKKILKSLSNDCESTSLKAWTRQKKLGQEILVRHGLVAFHSTLESLHESLSEAVSGRMVLC